MSNEEFGILCLKSTNSYLVFTQTERGYCFHILDQEEKIKSFTRFFSDYPENKFIPMNSKEADKAQLFLECLSKREIL